MLAGVASMKCMMIVANISSVAPALHVAATCQDLAYTPTSTWPHEAFGHLGHRGEPAVRVWVESLVNGPETIGPRQL